MEKVKINVLANRILVLPDDPVEKTDSGIILSPGAVEKPTRGKVVSVGGGTDIEPMVINVGDIVLYGKNVGSKIDIDGKNYLILKQTDILIYYEGNTKRG